MSQKTIIMKTIFMMLLFVVVSCGKESSPEGRSKIRDEKLQEKIDSLKVQNEQIIKDIRLIKKELKIENKGQK
ncbi:hypothetical protein GCM10008015_15330 [Flavobacterium palustre]|uniref:Lipoprotein n=2 Tax=Flavobacterium palustre TaxID=1476463 RepID=A0ABQ1HGR2_9FLAO|nr:hypothetical protein GCM10008015_15330 [Flavobacterium palustre]